MDCQDFFDTVEAASYFAAHRDLTAQEEAAFRHIPDRSVILDLGCGSGRTTRPLARCGHRVFGADIAFQMVKRAHEDGPAIPYCVADACRLAFKTGGLDAVVFSFNGIDNIHPEAARRTALEEIRRVLKPGGLFIFSTHNNCAPRDRDGVWPFLKSLFRKDRRVVISDASLPWGSVPTCLTTPEMQICELESTGFQLRTIIPNPAFSRVRSLKLLGYLDGWCYYVCARSKESRRGRLGEKAGM